MKEVIYIKEFENKGSLKNIFIPTGNEWESTENDDLLVIESGKKGVLFNKIIQNIDDAERVICLQSFLIQDTKIIDALVRASKRDVKVFILDSAEARLGNIEEEPRFSTIDYINMLEVKFKHNFVHRQAVNLHAKFILIDPEKSSKGFLFTGNFNKKPFFENPELAIELSIKQIKSFFEAFVYHFWEYTTDEQTARKDFDAIKRTDKFEKPDVSNMLLTSPNEELSNLKTTLIKAIEKTKNQITFSTFGFDIRNEVSKKILAKIEEGIKVTVFCRPREKAIKNNIEILAKKGAKVICHPLIHAKSLIIDNENAYVFTANFESHGMNSGFEVGVQLDSNQRNSLLKIHENWKDTFPLKYNDEILIKEVDAYFGLHDSRKEETIKPQREITKTNKPNKCSDIVSFIKEIKTPIKFTEKKQLIKVIFQFKNISENYKTINDLGNGLSEIVIKREQKKKVNGKDQIEIQKKEALLFTSENLNNEIFTVLQLEKYKNFNVYGK